MERTSNKVKPKVSLHDCDLACLMALEDVCHCKCRGKNHGKLLTHNKPLNQKGL
jgi:hypothetical protein